MEKFCQPHLARTGKRIRATRTVNDEPMCDACFHGKAIDPLEEHLGLPFFIAEPLYGKNAQAHAHAKDLSEGGSSD